MDKVTYASLGSLGEEFHQDFDKTLQNVRENLGQSYPLFIDGISVRSSHKPFTETNPSDQCRVLGKFQLATVQHLRRAIDAAKGAFRGWEEWGWKSRVAMLRRAAEIMTQEQMNLAVLLSLEVGKNRVEAIAEVSESIDLILYYCRQMEEHQGYDVPLEGSGVERTRSILRPYGVWAVVSPFNFPLALATGMCAGALVSGNTVVFKPASDTAWSGYKMVEIFHKAGLPTGVINLITGAGSTLSRELLSNRNIDGFVFTGSHEVGMKITKGFWKEYPKPCIVEMGGKNAAIVMPSANLDHATDGVLRSAFGMGGQKCSACSRLYLHRDISRSFMELFLEKTRKIRIGDPVERDVFLGPLINAAAVKKFQRGVALGHREGRVLQGGRVLKEGLFKHGFFVEPTIVDRLPRSSAMFQEEYFAPILAVAEVKSLEDALERANESRYGLTAGIFTADEAEEKEFFNRIEAGVTYSNRRGGATTGAWPGVQSFGGWKGSGSTGKSALGPYYVAQFMREQSQTRVSPASWQGVEKL